MSCRRDAHRPGLAGQCCSRRSLHSLRRSSISGRARRRSVDRRRNPPHPAAAVFECLRHASGGSPSRCRRDACAPGGAWKAQTMTAGPPRQYRSALLLLGVASKAPESEMGEMSAWTGASRSARGVRNIQEEAKSGQRGGPRSKSVKEPPWSQASCFFRLSMCARSSSSSAQPLK